MTMDPLHNPDKSAMRSFDGCWTCRLRRKKCDERRPVCGTCDNLCITCHYSHDKPEWMDGSVRQKEMTDQIKAEVKESADRRRWKRVTHASGSVPVTDTTITTGPIELSEQRPSYQPPWTKAEAGPSNCRPEAGNQNGNGTTMSQSDYILFSFYLEHLLPFLFPFYRPPILQGGRAWIMELMLSSPVMRQATLCQSSYFFSVIHGSSDCASLDALVGARTKDAFAMLRQSIQRIGCSDINEQLHDAARILVSILQLQRFEIAIMSFQNCQAHLNAAVALFRRLMEDVGGVNAVGPRLAYDTVLHHLGPSTRILPTDSFQVPSAEQAAFSFASALVILDDITTSTASQEEPKLYEYHRYLLGDTDSPLDAEAVVGCRNWILLAISEIARLDAWKQRCKRAESLDMMELVRRASSIKSSLETGLARLDIGPVNSTRGLGVLLSVFLGNNGRGPVSLCQKTLAIPVWAHAALLYLFIVVSGWQPRNAEVSHHVTKILDILTNGVEPPGLLRTIVWPFCIAGFLAQPQDEWRFRKLVHDLQPSSVFGTARKALELMENVWRKRDAENSINFDLGTLFSSPGELIMLV
ncbi:fungal-specific transcription factor domain-containing protein [Aspergillus carlsbadensis]|nr:fungal-specific transcription factor domain-containing protein [Aspergillus carlsbadensis]